LSKGENEEVVVRMKIILLAGATIMNCSFI